ncbi:hypothetical protein T08_6277 [Trichinella sp. T8]|uniref:Uncharacterized protein n=1 Tax=Trichinella murrelli TaxID=144512 RepID=A0A0V0TPH1_9BILA|nr:hypothetical protein T05_7985 [Trichinella murrelli]KRZ87585.1 hypothetical protein T08_6277 [Trichinella sp. T8]
MKGVDRRQLFQSFCGSMFNPLVQSEVHSLVQSMFNPLWFKGSMDEWMEFAFFLHQYYQVDKP